MIYKTYKVEMDAQTMRDVINLVDFCLNNYPFTKDSLLSFRTQLKEIISNGCFKHNIIGNIVRESSSSTISFCSLCNPDLAKKHKIKIVGEKKAGLMKYE